MGGGARGRRKLSKANIKYRHTVGTALMEEEQGRWVRFNRGVSGSGQWGG